MQHGKSLFTSCFHDRGSSAKPCPGLLADRRPCQCAGCIHALVESANKRLPESLSIAGRKGGGKLGARLPFTGDANHHHQFIPLLSSHGATRHLFLLTQSPFFHTCYSLPSIKDLSLFLFPPCLCTGWLSLSPRRQVAGGCTLLPVPAAGRDAQPSTGWEGQKRGTGAVAQTPALLVAVAGGFPQ